MTITQVLINDLKTDPQEIKRVEVKYSRKEKYQGFINFFQLVPLEAVLSLKKPISIHHRLHYIDFERLEEISFYFFDGRISVHNEIIE
ncbi:hypothetical protein [Chryseobacterium sp. JK1]|uniref:hypothetical protein n=1 Tax=Chryseobacterium sp. JK1 TaxID=874294 RepID=UPI003D69366A